MNRAKIKVIVNNLKHMHKPAKYFLAVVVILIGSLTLLLLYYGSGTSQKPIATVPDPARQIIDPQKLEADYRVKTKAIVAEVTSAVAAPAAEGTNLAGKARTELLGLTVPNKFKELHLELVLASDELLNFFNSGAEAKKLASLDRIKQAKTKYDWLN
jgi:hypothetical protein